MTEDAHDRAKRVIDARQLDDVSRPEIVWLEDHLESCGGCRAYSDATTNAIQAFRSLPIPLSVGLVEGTQRKVRVRAQELERDREDAFGLSVAAAMAFALTVITTPVIGQVLDWIGQRADISGTLLQFAYVWFWLVPSLSAALLLVFGHELPGDARMDFIKRGE